MKNIVVEQHRPIVGCELTEIDGRWIMYVVIGQEFRFYFERNSYRGLGGLNSDIILFEL